MAEPNLSVMKILRVGSMLRQMLDEQNVTSMDADALTSLRAVYKQTVEELEKALPPELSGELDRLSLPFDEDGELSEAELRIANAQLLGWLSGLLEALSLVAQAQSFSALPPPTSTPTIEGDLPKDGQYL